MQLSYTKKVSFFWPLLYLLLAISSPKVIALDVSNQVLMQWQNLIYYDKKFLIPSDTFLLSNKPKTPLAELETTIVKFNQHPHLSCDYPARYSFLDQHGYLTHPFDISHCGELNDFLTKAPAERFSYVFASNNLSSVTSMMGHGLLVAQSVDDQNIIRNHAFSFNLDLTNIGSLEVIYKSLLTGIEGVFVLRPYEQDLKHYTQQEGRELWRYELNLTPNQVRQLHFSIWELQFVNADYVYQAFNCATLILHTLSIAHPPLLDYKTLFVTPLDIAKALEAEQLVNHIYITQPPTGPDSTDESTRPIANQKSEQYTDQQTIDELKSPTLRPQDSIVTVYKIGSDNHATFLPTSHLLRTSSLASKDSTELVVGYIDVNLSNMTLNELILYSYKDYIPLQNKLSSEVYIGYRPKALWHHISEKSSLEVDYLMGHRFNLNNAHISGLVGFGLARQLSLDAKLSVSFSLGNRAKFNANLHHKIRQHGDTSIFSTSLSKMFDSTYNVSINHELQMPNEVSRIAAGIDFHF